MNGSVPLVGPAGTMIGDTKRRTLVYPNRLQNPCAQPVLGPTHVHVYPLLSQHVMLKGGMSSSPEIHGFSPGGFQYGVFRISVRIPVFAMAKMSPRGSNTLAVEVVR